LEEVRHAPGGEYTESEIVKFHALVRSEIRRPVYPVRHHETFGEISRTNLVSDKIDNWPQWVIQAWRQQHGVIGIRLTTGLLSLLSGLAQ
jgi:hypothetical protein